MKKIIYVSMYTLLILVINIRIAASQITNSGFESWATGWSGFLDPVDWSTNNGQFPIASVIQSTGHSGSYAAKLRSASPIGLSGALYWYSPASAIKPTALSGFIKTNIVGPQDFLRIQLNVTDISANQIGSLDHYISNTGPLPWMQFNYTVNYTSSNTPNEYSISFIHGVVSGTTTGYAEIDDLTLTYLTALNEEITNAIPGVLMLDGNESETKRLVFDLLSKSSVIIEVFDITGKKIRNYQDVFESGHSEFTMEIGDFNSGIYVCFVQMGNIRKSFKFVRE